MEIKTLKMVQLLDLQGSHMKVNIYSQGTEEKSVEITKSFSHNVLDFGGGFEKLSSFSSNIMTPLNI